MDERLEAEIVVTGDEITSGQILDTNSQWLSQRLEELGVHVRYHTAVGDDIETIAGVIRQAVGRSDIVVVTGGLGPTPADVTREAIAQAVGRKLVLNEEALESIRQLFARRQRPMPPRNEKQAMLPEGARPIANLNGTAPGIDLEVDRADGKKCRLFALPGVPAEMREMWTHQVVGRLRQAGVGTRMILRRRLHAFGAGESQIVAMLPGLIKAAEGPQVGITAHEGTITLRIAVEGPTLEACQAAAEPIVQQIRQKLGHLVFGEEDEGLEHAVIQLLRQRRQNLAVVEWGTEGLVNRFLASVPEGAGFYLGGLVVADPSGLKQALNLPEQLLQQHGLRSAAVAEVMARRLSELFQTDWALAVPCFPPFDPQAEKPELAALALAHPGGAKSRTLPYAAHPAMLKVLFAKHALNFLRLELLGAGS
ncbi:MAG: CinA family nicotinamide mononucleotide deamidase-related protein [Thermoguttaceae bacterium]|nr:CinA family nicotinamide mononucleotide deamidase-related protein [Thermoguttaceae bacterium]MDW8039244.1 CinA family nicotinamide mononucleotide deamidase-related protein [Thermoguttaceae bacterium]